VTGADETTKADDPAGRLQALVMCLLRQQWPMGCWFIFGGKAVISSPVCMYWTIWPSLVLYRSSVSLYWLRRGIRLEWNPPDAPLRNGT